MITLLVSYQIAAQACCTAGTPIMGSLDMSTSPAGHWQISLTHEYNYLNSVYESTMFIDDDSRQRVTNASLLELNLGVTSGITVTSLFSFVNQSRTVSSQSGSVNEIKTSGIGDAVMMVKYSIIPLDMVNETELAFGTGIKMPLGKSMLRNNGILLPADMQPGSGAWDLLLWIYYTKGRVLNEPLNLVANISYKQNGTNKRFGVSAGDYKFGNEFLVSLGLAYRTNSILDYSLFIRLRHTDPDEFSAGSIPNTGGNWLNIVPG